MSFKGESLVVASKHVKSSNAERNYQNENSVIRELGSIDHLECSMCGDIGLRQELFRCTQCHFRVQHTYCSHSYPKKRSYSGVCNWCDKDDGLVHVPRTDVFKALVETESSKSRRWNNEMEMLLEAVAVALEKERELECVSNSFGPSSGSNCSVNKRPRKMLRAKSYPEKTEDIKATVDDNGLSDCKNTKLQRPTLSKRMGRRYKFILDVY